MHLILGGDTEARAKLNELARALMLDYFINEMEGKRFLTEEEVDNLLHMVVVPDLDLLVQDWDELEAQFKARGEGDPDSPAYVVNSVADLLNRPMLEDAIVS